MRFVFLFFSLFLSLSLCAQVTLKRDSSNALIIVSTLQQPDGTTVTVESAAVDSSTVKDRIFNTTLESYAAIARLEDELRNMRKQADNLRQVGAGLDTSNYFSRTRSIYAAQMHGEYTYKQGAQVFTVEIRANAANTGTIIVTGTRRGTVRIYAPDYIEIRGYFQTASGLTIDLFLCRKGQNWQGEIDGKIITLKRKRS